MHGQVTDGLNEQLLQSIGLHDLVPTSLERLPSRVMAPFVSRRFDSHLSSADLVGLWISGSWVPARFWLGLGVDAWGRGAGVSGKAGESRL